MDKRILIVDDDHGILDAITLALQYEGYVVEGISKGEETFHKIKQFKPAVIILDMYLSGTNGTIICKQLKSNKHTQNINIIMMSAHPTAASYISEVHADAFLAKPFNISELVDMIEKNIAKTN